MTQALQVNGQYGTSHTASRRVQFGVFDVDLAAGELRRSGVRVRLQSQPFKLLTVLLDRPGEVVSREELQQQLWGNSTTVDFDHSLGIAVNKLREALGDSAENPRFVETLSRRGYRFIAPVKTMDPQAHEPVEERMVFPVSSQPGKLSSESLRLPSRLLPPLWFSIALATVSVALAILLLLRPPSRKPYRVSQVTYSGHVLSNETDVEGYSNSVGDGTRLYFSHVENGSPALGVALVANGEISRLHLPPEIGEPLIGALSPDGSELIVHSHLQATPEQPLWIVPTLGGNVHQVPKVLAHDATWMPGSGTLLIASGNDLVVVGEDGTDPHKLLTLPGQAFWMRWSPDGSRLRFTLHDPTRQTTELWEVAADGSNPHPLLPGWSSPAAECCGNWTPDGQEYVFQADHEPNHEPGREVGSEGHSQIWALRERPWYARDSKPRQITNGPLDFEAPSTAPGGHRIYLIGVNSQLELLQALPRAEMEKLKALPRAGSVTPLAFNALDQNLTSAALAEYSPDGKWVAWLNSTDGYLWRSRVNGFERIELTAPPLRIFSMKWSPDNKRLALMAKEPGKPWKLYMIDSDGGKLTPLLNEDRNEADPNWSADGKTLVFGRLPDRMDGERAPKAIYLMDVDSRKVTEVPGSTGLFSPRLSPDGRYMIAIRLDQRALLLLDRTTQKWTTLSTHGAGDPLWSHDGRSVYFQDFLEQGKPIYKVSVPDGHLEQIATIGNLRPITASDYRLLSLAPGDLPVVSARTSAVNLYTVDLNER